MGSPGEEAESFLIALIAGAEAIEQMENSYNSICLVNGKSLPFREAAIILREKACEIAYLIERNLLNI